MNEQIGAGEVPARASPRRPRVALCIPAYDGWRAEMGFDALRLAIHSAPLVDLTVAFTRGQDTSEARNYLVDQILHRDGAEAVDAILWIDADMMFPPDALIRLLLHRVPIVGADYRLRGQPFPRLGMRVDPDNPFGKYKFPSADDPKTGLDDAMAVLGFGLLLTRMRVYQHPEWQRPWFMRTWNPQARRVDNPTGFSTEDTNFCTMARLCGFKVCCDLDLSAEVSHIGQMTIPWNLGKTHEGRRDTETAELPGAGSGDPPA